MYLRACGNNIRNRLCSLCDFGAGNSFVYNPNPNSFKNSQKDFDHPPQPMPPIYDEDYDKERIISTNTDIFETPSSDAITTSPPVLPIDDPEVSLIMGNEELNTIPEKESDEFIKSSVEDLVPIPSESEDTSRSESVCILPSCDDFSPNDIPEEKANIKSKYSYDSNLDESDLLVTPLSDANEDECFDSRGNVDENNDFEDNYYDSKGDILYLESFLSDDTTPNLPPE
nr:hypothetical protein [Tanacetum cinerariifolium]